MAKSPITTNGSHVPSASSSRQAPCALVTVVDRARTKDRSTSGTFSERVKPRPTSSCFTCSTMGNEVEGDGVVLGGDDAAGVSGQKTHHLVVGRAVHLAPQLRELVAGEDVFDLAAGEGLHTIVDGADQGREGGRDPWGDVRLGGQGSEQLLRHVLHLDRFQHCRGHLVGDGVLHRRILGERRHGPDVPVDVRHLGMGPRSGDRERSEQTCQHEQHPGGD